MSNVTIAGSSPRSYVMVTTRDPGSCTIFTFETFGAETTVPEANATIAAKLTTFAIDILLSNYRKMNMNPTDSEFRFPPVDTSKSNITESNAETGDDGP